jgi:hypothetical protein
MAEEAIEVSYQLEREMRERVSRYQEEADLRRSLPHSSFRSRLARALRAVADRVEPARFESAIPGERRSALVNGRNH